MTITSEEGQDHDQGIAALLERNRIVPVHTHTPPPPPILVPLPLDGHPKKNGWIVSLKNIGGLSRPLQTA